MAIDTIKLITNIDVFSDLSIENFGKSQIQAEISNVHNLFDKNNITQKAPSHTISTRKQGGAWVKINPYQEVEIEFSAKTLKEKYLQGIDINNIDYAMQNINKTLKGYCQIDINKFIDNSTLRKVHNTVTLKTQKESINDTIYSLQVAGRVNYKKTKDKYSSTVEFSTSKETIEIYDKLKELNDNKDMLAFINLKKLLTNKESLLRTEYKLDSLSKVRDIYTKNNLDLNIQTALEKKNSNKILKYCIKQINTIEEQKMFSTDIRKYKELGYSYGEIKKLYSYLGIFKEVDFSYHKLEEEILSMIPKKSYRSQERKNYKELYHNHNNIIGVSENINCQDEVRKYKDTMLKLLSA